jgi:hypothetical protein
MHSFIDLVGASGTAYRFRQVQGGYPPTGGNFVFVREEGEGVRVVCCGKAPMLIPTQIEKAWSKDELHQEGDHLYVRLNVATLTRDTEHDDLVDGLPRPFAIYETP